MASFKARVAAGIRRFERRLGIDREGRSVWVWLLPPSIGLVTGFLVPFMPGLPGEMGLVDRITLSIFGFVTMTAIASIYLISFDNDHNQQAPVDDPPERGQDPGPETPVAPSGSPPPQWVTSLEAVPVATSVPVRRASKPRVPTGAPR
jgi:hypothetical protein